MTDHRRDPELAPFGEMTVEAREAIREERLKAAEADYSPEEQAQLEEELAEARRNFMYTQEAKAKRAKKVAEGLSPQQKGHMLAKMRAHIHYVHDRRRSITLVRMTLEREIREAEEVLNENLLVFYRLPDNGEHRIVVPSTWDCPGPLGTCVYDDRQDPMHDNCLECHEPQERK